jgi:hypothetical protein
MKVLIPIPSGIGLRKPSMEECMKMTVKRDPENVEVVEVHLEFGTALRAAVNATLWAVGWILLGIALHRAYIHLVAS